MPLIASSRGAREGNEPGRSSGDEIRMVRPDGTVACVADALSHPDGMVITPDGSTLLACETYTHRVVAFTVASDGTLSDKRDFATDIP